MHQLFLQRAATNDEARTLAHLVHLSGPTALTARLALSPEWAGVRIDELYRNVLGREPEPGGQAYWLDQLKPVGRLVAFDTVDLPVDAPTDVSILGMAGEATA